MTSLSTYQLKATPNLPRHRSLTTNVQNISNGTSSPILSLSSYEYQGVSLLTNKKDSEPHVSISLSLMAAWAWPPEPHGNMDLMSSSTLFRHEPRDRMIRQHVSHGSIRLVGWDFWHYKPHGSMSHVIALTIWQYGRPHDSISLIAART